MADGDNDGKKPGLIPVAYAYRDVPLAELKNVMRQ
jgi:hypothetical protein